jgi:hypothetical protein
MGTLLLENEFSSYEHFCGVVVNKIFEDKNIEGTIEEIDWESDLHRRIFILMEDGRDYVIRTWDITDDDNFVYVDFTLYLEDNDLDTTFEV